MNSQEQIRQAISSIAAENDKDFGKGGWVNVSLLSSEIQAYLKVVKNVEMSIVEIEQINEQCGHASLISELKRGKS